MSNDKTLQWYIGIKLEIISRGYEDEISWSQNIQPVNNSYDFWIEYAWVVLNSGMKEQIARQIWSRVRPAVESGNGASSVFGHKGKSKAIDYVYVNRDRMFAEYLESDKKIEWLQKLPWIGNITKWHLAKNYGFDCAKPDRHLVRIAGKEGAGALCRRLSERSGDRIATVDLVIWRAANLGII